MPKTIEEMVEEMLDQEIARGKRIFLFPAKYFSLEDCAVHTVADRIGCHNLTVGLSAITPIDRRTRRFSQLMSVSPLVQTLKDRNEPLSKRRWFVARI